MPDLPGQDAAAPEHDVVGDLHQIINHRAGADHGVVTRAAVDRGVGADVDIVADDDAAELRHLDRARLVGSEAEPGLADAHSWMQTRRARRSAHG